MTAWDAEEVVARFMSQRVGPAVSPIDEAMAREMTAQHVSQMFEYLSLREKNRHTEETDRTKTLPSMTGAALLIVLAFTFFFAWLCLSYQKSEVILPVITGVCGLAAGGFGGYGIGRNQAGKKTGPGEPPQ